MEFGKQAGRYGAKTLVGNYHEERELQEARVRDYLARKKSGNLLIHSVQRHLQRCLRDAGLTYSEDGAVHFGDHVMLFSHKTEAVLSVDMGERTAALQESYPVTTSSVAEGPVVRNVFVIQPFDKKRDKEGEPLRLGQKFRLMVNPLLNPEPLYLHSQPVSQLSSSKMSRHQEVTASVINNYESVWKVELENIQQRLERTGEPVPANEAVVLIHSPTLQALASDPQYAYVNDFGKEFEVSAHTFTTIGKTEGLIREQMGATGGPGLRREFPQNHWSILTAETPELGARVEEEKKAVQHEGATILERVRAALKKRGADSIAGIGRTFRIMDDDGNKTLSLQEFKFGLKDAGLLLTPEESSFLAAYFDRNKDGSISYDEFLLALRGKMNDERRAVVDAVFKRIDANGNGVLEPDDIADRYDCSRHPKVVSKEKTKNQVLQEMLALFEGYRPDGKVTLEEFRDYYDSVSASIDNDEHFKLLVETAWKRFPGSE